MEKILQQEYLQNTVLHWLIAAGIAIALFFIIQTLRAIIVKRLAKIADRTATKADDTIVAMLKRTNGLLMAVVSLFFGSLSLTLPDRASSLVGVVVKTALLVQIALWGMAVIDFIISNVRTKKREADPASSSALAVMSFFARLILWCLVIFVILENLGVDITALIAGLGIGGIAVALALQNSLGDIFCSIAILVDKPFEVGDFIIVGDMMGVVEKIGIKTTRIRSLSGEQLVFSNSDMVGSRIRNYKRMQERRVVFSFGVVYQTAADTLETIPAIVREIIEGCDQTRFDRAHFKEYGDSSLDFECVYYVLNADYNLYMDIQQRINLELFRRFEREGIVFAYPTRTLYIEKDSPESV